MNFGLSTNALWALVMQSDFLTKLVLLVLLAMSIICWAIFLYKYILFSVKKNQLSKTLARMQDIKSLDELRALVAADAATLPGYFLRKNLNTLKALLEAHPDRKQLSDKEFELLQYAMEQDLEDIMHNEEAYLPVLFTSAASAPLVGLFGTVWGLIHAFMRISEKQSADIATVAPGIAEALITTLAGLVVAIPSLMMYHYLATQVRKIEQQLFRISDKFIWIVQRLFVG